MKKVILFFALALISAVTFHSCGPCDCTNYTPLGGVVHLDSTQQKITTFDWSWVNDTTSGFITVPLGFEISSLPSDGRDRKFDLKQTRFVNTMLKEFQKRFKLNVTNFQRVEQPWAEGVSQTQMLIFYQPAVDPQIEEFQKQLALHEIAQQQLKKQNRELISLVNGIALSNRKIKWQLTVLKKAVDEKNKIQN